MDSDFSRSFHTAVSNTARSREVDGAGMAIRNGSQAGATSGLNASTAVSSNDETVALSPPMQFPK